MFLGRFRRRIPAAFLEHGAWDPSLRYSETRLSYERTAEGMLRSEDYAQHDTVLFLGSLDVAFDIVAFRMPLLGPFG